MLAWVIIFSSCVSTPIRRQELSSRQAYINSHFYLNSSIKDAIIKEKVIKGMTFDDVRATWGEPNVIETSIDNKFLNQGEELWLYNRLFLIPIFVHFKEGIVVSVADDVK